MGGPRAGASVVCKRARDGLPPEEGRADSETLVQLADAAPEEIALREQAIRSAACPKALNPPINPPSNPHSPPSSPLLSLSLSLSPSLSPSLPPSLPPYTLFLSLFLTFSLPPFLPAPCLPTSHFLTLSFSLSLPVHLSISLSSHLSRFTSHSNFHASLPLTVGLSLSAFSRSIFLSSSFICLMSMHRPLQTAARSWFLEESPYSIVWYYALFCLGSAVLLPYSPFCLAIGYIFGVGQGVLIQMGAILLSSVSCFTIGRYLLKNSVGFASDRGQVVVFFTLRTVRSRTG